jgi:16S rRNA U1498 N3-methylase RsmE
MAYQHIENLLRRYRGQIVNVKTISGGIYEGKVADVTNDYVALTIANEEQSSELVIVLLHSVEAVLPRNNA